MIPNPPLAVPRPQHEIAAPPADAARVVSCVWVGGLGLPTSLGSCAVRVINLDAA